MVARLTNIEDGVEVGCLSTACQHGTHAAFQSCYLRSNGIVGGILQTGIEVALLLQIEQLGHLVGVIILESGRLDNGQLYGFPILCPVACMHTERALT